MAPDRLREALRALPFQPFSVEVPGGKKVPIEHPDFAQLSPGGRTLVIFGKDDEWMEMMDVFLISSLSFGRRKTTRRR